MPRLAQDLPHSPWGTSQGLAGTFFYGTPAHFYLSGIKEHLAQSVGHLSVLLPTRPKAALMPTLLSQDYGPPREEAVG